MNARAICVVVAAVAGGAAFLGGVGPADGQAPVNIPDYRLNLEVHAALHILQGQPIYPVDMLNLTYLDGWGYLDLTGLEYAANLWFLKDTSDWRFKGATSLAPLTGLANLRDVNIDYWDSNGPITTLAPLAASTRMTRLEVNNYQIGDTTGLGGMTGMKYLDLSSNKIAEISALSGMTALETLSLYDNEITDISPLAGMTALKELRLYRNRLTSIGAIAGMTSLDQLWVSHNQIVDISSARFLTAATFLDFDDNRVNFLPDLSGLPNLNVLALGFNQLAEISNVANLSSLKQLSLNDNQISDISPLASLHNLELLDLLGNPLNAEAYSTWIPTIRNNNPGVVIYYDALPEPATGGFLTFGLLTWLLGRGRRRWSPKP